MGDYNAMRDATEKAFANPKAGQEFHEMYSFWVRVESVSPEGWIVVTESGKPRLFASADEFRAAYAYKTIPGYSVDLYERPGAEHGG